MKQQESSRIRNKETRATVPAGTLTSLANQKKLLLARRRKDLLIKKRQCLTDVIEEQDVLESHNPEARVRIQANSTNNVVQPVEEQLQLNSTALKVNEQCKEQGKNIHILFIILLFFFNYKIKLQYYFGRVIFSCVLL